MFEAIEYVCAQFPFPIWESTPITAASSSTTICSTTATKITFTRSRSGNKNDGAHVEQKNWTHVRELVGYLRFDTAQELSILNRIWALDMVYTNYLLAQQKAIFKQRNGSKVTKRYDRAITPFERTMARTSVDGAARRSMQAVMNVVRPGISSGRSKA